MHSVNGWHATALPGVLRRHLAPIADSRGSFTELWRSSLTAGLDDAPFVQANLSRSRAGVLRGMHFHRRQSDLWLLIEGRALAATTDLRGATVASQVVELAPGDALFIPRLVAHGFWALEDTTLEYLVTNEYDGTDEHGFAWNDPLAAIGWPAGEPILSERDLANPALPEVLARDAQQSSPR
jgi:dTDP-4-dehydrorhamnose 3,5-epimerase